MESRANRSVKIPPPRISVFRFPKNEKFTNGFGFQRRRSVAATSRNAPPHSMATIVPDPSQSSRSPCSSAPSTRLSPTLAKRKPLQLTAGLGPCRGAGGGIAR